MGLDQNRGGGCFVLRGLFFLSVLPSDDVESVDGEECERGGMSSALQRHHFRGDEPLDGSRAHGEGEHEDAGAHHEDQSRGREVLASSLARHKMVDFPDFLENQRRFWRMQMVILEPDLMPIGKWTL